jgi:thiol-disulfide isomerase/thioredoxin
MKFVDKGIKFVKDLCDNDETCVMIVFIVIGLMLCYLFKDQVSGFANLDNIEDALMDTIGGPIQDKGGNLTQGNLTLSDKKPIGIELKPRKPEPTPSTSKQLQVMASKPSLAKPFPGQQVPGLKMDDASIFRPFDEVWNPGFMPLDMVFKDVPSGPKPGPMGPMGPDRPMRDVVTGPAAGGVQSSEDVNLVLVYAPWCGHSKKMLPDYEKIKTEFHGKVINGKKFNILMYNSDVDKDKVKEYGVNGFPSLFLEKDGNRESFPHRTYDKISDSLSNL